MENNIQNLLWEAMLSLKNKVESSRNYTDEYSIVLNNGSYQVNYGIADGNINQKIIFISRKPKLSFSSTVAFFALDDHNNITLQGRSFLETSANTFLKNYLPFCFSKNIAQRLGRTYAILHLAQSIDGKIATVTGRSKWVSGHEDLVHTHRMRALCDAILIGSNTLMYDSPRLTVRHVSGSNPIKVVIANTACDFGNLKASGDKILLFTSKQMKAIEGVEIITIPSTSGLILSELILSELFKRNIFSLFIEGGAITASHFIERNAVDKVQLFISPNIFGSGIDCFTLPAIDKVEDAKSFLNSTFRPMGNGVLFEGELVHSQSDSSLSEKRFQKHYNPMY